MLVVQVGCVDERFVPIPMTVRLAHRIVGTALMLMVFIVEVQVLVFEQFVRVCVFMPLAEMQPRTDCHQHQGRQSFHAYQPTLASLFALFDRLSRANASKC